MEKSDSPIFEVNSCFHEMCKKGQNGSKVALLYFFLKICSPRFFFLVFCENAKGSFLNFAFNNKGTWAS